LTTGGEKWDRWPRAVVKQDDVTDDAKIHSLRLEVLNIALSAADFVSSVRKSILDIVYPAFGSPFR
jgi:hypothetical protein